MATAVSKQQQQLLLRYCNHTNHLTDLVATMVPSLWDRNRQKETHIMFRRFVYEMLKVMGISNNCVFIALYYIQRLFRLYPNMKTEPGFEVRTFTTALMLANKYHEDFTFRSKSWAEVSGIKLNELNLMEGEFMSAMRYQLHITKGDFNLWVEYCQSQIYSCRQHIYNTIPSPSTPTPAPLHNMRAAVSDIISSNDLSIPKSTTAKRRRTSSSITTEYAYDQHCYYPYDRQQERRQQAQTICHYHPQHFLPPILTQQRQHQHQHQQWDNTMAPIIKKRKERDDELVFPSTSLKRRAFKNTMTQYIHLTSANLPPGHQQHRFAVPAYP